jgi:hypothetical protein
LAVSAPPEPFGAATPVMLGSGLLPGVSAGAVTVMFPHRRNGLL